MKTLGKLCAVVIVGFTLLAFGSNDNTLALADAIAQHKVQATVLPFGDKGYSEGLRVNVKNISGKSLKVKMPKGTIFIPDDDGEQTLITQEDEIFALNSNQEKLIKKQGYCTELHDHGSGKESTFKLSFSQNEKLLNVIAFMDSLKVKDEDLVQNAIWCVTDRQPIAYIYGEDTTASRLIQKRVGALMGQPVPWYNTRSNIVRTPQREFIVEPKEIAGELSFRATERVELQGMVKDSTGKVIATNPRKMTCPPGNVTFEYRLTVQGWEKGKYSVVYLNNGVEVINQPFEL